MLGHNSSLPYHVLWPKLWEYSWEYLDNEISVLKNDFSVYKRSFEEIKYTTNVSYKNCLTGGVFTTPCNGIKSNIK